MAEVFTAYLRSLSSASAEPEPEQFERAWKALRRLLRNEICRRGLWERPPAYLGVVGSGSWKVQGDASAAIEELVADCYAYIFLRRFGSLNAQLVSKPNIEGLVRLNVRHFLMERQRRHDPLGYRIFDVLRCSVRQGVEEGRFTVETGGAALGNDTRLRLRGAPRGGARDEARLDELVTLWVPRLLPDLVTARGRSRAALQARLVDRLAGIFRIGIRVFSLGEVLAPLRTEVRLWWASVYDQGLGESAIESGDDELLHIVRVVRPDGSFEDRHAFDRLSARIAEELDRLPLDTRSRDYLLRTWSYLCSWAGSGAYRPPSRRQVARDLGIPRDRLPDLYSALGRVVRECLSNQTATTGR